MATALKAAFGLAQAEASCAQPLKSFREVAIHLETLPNRDNATVLRAERLTAPGKPCMAVWLIEFLSSGGAVTTQALDARTLEPLDTIPEFANTTAATAPEQPSEEIIPVLIWVQGSPRSDLLEGEWSDDISTGGAGRDVFLLTPGRDVITDFNPQKDALDLTNFSGAEFGFGTLPNFTMLQAASRLRHRDGRPVTEIDLDGDAGDWTVTLLGISPSDLSLKNVRFPAKAEPPWGAKLVAMRRVQVSDGSIVVLPGHRVGQPPPAPVLVSGSNAALVAMRVLFFFEDEGR